MKCISLWQPWASLLFPLKKFETRAWPTSHRGDVLIHAAARRTEPAEFCDVLPWSWWAQALIRCTGDDDLEELPYGAILGVVSIDDCRRTDAMQGRELNEAVIHRSRMTQWHLGDFRAGRFAWTLSNPRRFASPVRWRGQQGMFEVPYSIIAEATASLA